MHKGIFEVMMALLTGVRGHMAIFRLITKEKEIMDGPHCHSLLMLVAAREAPNSGSVFPSRG
jgi:hypothetical protein